MPLNFKSSKEMIRDGYDRTIADDYGPIDHSDIVAIHTEFPMANLVNDRYPSAFTTSAALNIETLIAEEQAIAAGYLQAGDLSL